MCIQNQFRKYGGTLHDGEPLISVTPGDIVVVTTSLRQYTCRSVVLCLGPWTSKFIKTWSTLTSQGNLNTHIYLLQYFTCTH